MIAGIAERLPGQLTEVYGSEAYTTLVELNEKRKAEEKELFDLYDHYTKDGSSSNRRDFALGEYAEQVHHYIDDLKANHLVPESVISRFENYATMFKQPENKANVEFRDAYTKTISQERWAFEKDLNEKAAEVFGDDQVSETFKKKAFDRYQEILSAAEEQTIPDKVKYINTMGTYYGVPNK